MRNLWLLFLVGLASGFISDKLLVSSQAPLTTVDDLYLEGRSSGDLPIDDEDREDDGSGSGSGDYAFNDLDIQKILNFSWSTKEMSPPEATPDSPQPSTTAAAAAADSQEPSTTEDTGVTPFIIPEEVGHPDEFSLSTTTSAPASETTSRDAVSTEFEEDNGLEQYDPAVTPKYIDEVYENPIEVHENEIVHSGGKGGRLLERAPEGVTSENLWERTEVLAAVIACGVVGFLCAVFLLMLLAYRMKKKDEGSYDLGDTKLSTTAYHKAPTKEFYA